MIRKRDRLAYTKKIVRNGRSYEYFDCGKASDGKRRYVRLPDRSDPSFGGKYAALLGHRSRKIEVAKAAMKLNELIALYERSPRYRKLARNSQDSYSNYLGRFSRALGNPVASDVDRAAVTLVLNRMIDTPAASNQMLRTVNALYQWARGNTEITADPCRDIEEHEGGEHQPWPEELLAEGLASDDPRIKLAVSLLYYTAQRIGDVCNMAWSDITPSERLFRWLDLLEPKDTLVRVKSLRPFICKLGDRWLFHWPTLLIDRDGHSRATISPVWDRTRLRLLFKRRPTLNPETKP